jgi:hypothetical protein
MPAGGVASTSVAHAQEAHQGTNARAAEPTSPTIHDQGTRMLLISIDPPRKASMDSIRFRLAASCRRRKPKLEKPVNVSEKKV